MAVVNENSSAGFAYKQQQQQTRRNSKPRTTTAAMMMPMMAQVLRARPPTFTQRLPWYEELVTVAEMVTVSVQLFCT